MSEALKHERITISFEYRSKPGDDERFTYLREKPIPEMPGEVQPYERHFASLHAVLCAIEHASESLEIVAATAVWDELQLAA